MESWRILATCAAVGVVLSSSACASPGEEGKPQPVKSDHHVGDLCSRILDFTRSLGFHDVYIDGPVVESAPIGKQGSCEVHGPTSYGTTTRAVTAVLTLSPDGIGPRVPQVDKYQPVVGSSSEVWFANLGPQHHYSANINGWSGGLTVDPGGLNTAAGPIAIDEETSRLSAEFLATLIRELGQWA